MLPLSTNRLRLPPKTVTATGNTADMEGPKEQRRGSARA